MSVRDLTILGCSSQQPTRYRNHGGYLLRWNGEGLLFDPGEGTQRQFIFTNIAPPVVNRIFISHFHGDHCLGLGSMLMRLNLDKVKHPIHCYYPASGKRYFDRLRYGTIYHETIQVIEHPIREEGLVHEDESFKIEACFLNHGTDNLAYRVTEPDDLKLDKEKLRSFDIRGLQVKELLEKGYVWAGDRRVELTDVSWVRKGSSFAVVIDTRFCENAVEIAKDVQLLLCESTYLERDQHLARKYMHLTAKDAATIAARAHADMLVLTHYSARYLDVKEFEKEAAEIFPHVYAGDDFARFQLRRR